MSLDVFVRSTLQSDPRALDGWEAFASEPAAAFGSERVVAYRRRAATREGP